jgi:hypothetical protein
MVFLSQVCNLKQDTLKGSLSDLNVMLGMPRNQKGKPLHEQKKIQLGTLFFFNLFLCPLYVLKY